MQLNDTHSLAVFVRQRRKELALTQAQLAGKVGVSREWVVRLEKGNPRLEVGMVLAALRAMDAVPEVGRKDASPAREEMKDSPVAQVLGPLSQQHGLQDRLRTSAKDLVSRQAIQSALRPSTKDIPASTPDLQNTAPDGTQERG